MLIADSVIEHSGGVPKVGLISNSGRDGAFELTPISEWHPESLDSFLEILAEHEDAGTNKLRQLITQRAVPEIEHIVSRAIWIMLLQITGARDARLAVHQIAWVVGIWPDQLLGKLASKHGLSKQAFEQGAKKYRLLFNGLRSQSARSAEAKENMRQRNYRHNGSRPH